MLFQITRQKVIHGTLSKRYSMNGITYIEVLVTVVLIAVVLVPAMEALLPATQGMAIHASRTEQNYHLAAILDDVLAQPFANLDAEAVTINNPAIASTVYSDLPASPNRRLVYLSRYDADNADGNGDPFNGTDEGLLWIRVEIENSGLAIESLSSVYD